MTTLVKRGTARRLGLRVPTVLTSYQRRWITSISGDGGIQFLERWLR